MNTTPYEQLQSDACNIARDILNNADTYPNELVVRLARAWALIAKEELLATQRADSARRDAEYYKWRLDEIIPLFQEARDALMPLTVVQCRLHNISLSLADRMDAAGTRTREEFDSMTTIPLTKGLEP